MEPVTLQEALRYCLENPERLDAEELLDKFPQYREELEPLISLDARLGTTLPQTMSPHLRAAMRERVAAASRPGGDALASRSASPSHPAPIGPAPQQERDGAGAEGGYRPARSAVARVRWPAWISVAIVVLIVFVWYVSSIALPDSPFYGVKVTTENALLSIAGSQADLASQHIRLANARLYDLRAMHSAGKLDRADSAFNNYDDHVRGSLDIRASLGGTHIDLDKLLYSSSVAGQRTFERFGSAVATLPAGLQAMVGATVQDLKVINAISGQALQTAGLNLDQVLQSADSSVAMLLASEAGTSGGTPTPLSTTTAKATQTLVQPANSPGTPLPEDIQATQTTVLYIAQTVVVEGGTTETPFVQAAKTVLAGATGPPLVQAQQTIIRASRDFPTQLPTPNRTQIVITVTPVPSITATP